MTNANARPKQDPRNLAQLVRGELEAIAEEAKNQVTAGGEKKEKPVTQPPPLPSGQKLDSDSAGGQKEAVSEEEELRRVRNRLSVLNEESALAWKELSREREEAAQERNPVVEGVGSGGERDDEKLAGQGSDGNLPPLQANTSRPKRGLPLWTVGQSEKRQRR